MSAHNLHFRERLHRGERLLGAFLKTPTVHATEILAEVDFDFVAVDQEHAPFDRRDLDALALASQTSGIASLVRVSDASPSRLLGVLDLGFAGVIVPHIASVEQAREAVSACRFAGGSRGFSNSPRAGRYGALGIAEYIDKSDREVTVIAMIEDVAALEAIDAIVAVEGIHAVLIGRADLAVALGERSLSAPAVVSAVDRVLAACRVAGRRVMLHIGNVEEVRTFAELGVTLFLVGSDQSMIRTAALAVHERFHRTG